ncbi:GNAT family N-acetyltransferase [Bacteriovorax sp. BSW11_IV]|uniref:GNAT family N-acetyltransferase n=1 Tax=Bacteriovorax sp. BSW11_IV TaxID=1353529 RepID=UPI00042927AA|nr:GNAT family protein [Bacteriovorax sp. BSW11_IV]
MRRTMPNDYTISLEELSDKFIDEYLKLINDQKVSETTEPGEELEPFSREKALQWLQSLKDKNDRADFAIIKNSTNEFVGEVVINEIKNNIGNIRIAILPKFFDQGFGTQAMKLAIDHGFKNLELKVITLSVYEINPRGIKVYKRLGFKELRRELDDKYMEIFMELHKKDWDR